MQPKTAACFSLLLAMPIISIPKNASAIEISCWYTNSAAAATQNPAGTVSRTSAQYISLDHPEEADPCNSESRQSASISVASSVYGTSSASASGYTAIAVTDTGNVVSIFEAGMLNTAAASNLYDTGAWGQVQTAVSIINDEPVAFFFELHIFIQSNPDYGDQVNVQWNGGNITIRDSLSEGSIVTGILAPEAALDVAAFIEDNSFSRSGFGGENIGNYSIYGTFSPVPLPAPITLLLAGIFTGVVTIRKRRNGNTA